MMDIIQKLAGMVTGQSGNHHAPGSIVPAAGNPAVPMGLSPQNLGQATMNYAKGTPMGGESPGINPHVGGAPLQTAGAPSAEGPAPDAGVLPGGNSNMDILLRTLKGAQAGMDASQKNQQTQQTPSWAPMQLQAPQGQIIPSNKQAYQKRY